MILSSPAARAESTREHLYFDLLETLSGALVRQCDEHLPDGIYDLAVCCFKVVELLPPGPPDPPSSPTDRIA